MLNYITAYKEESSSLFSAISNELILDFVNIIIDAYVNQSTIFVCANGGGASAAENFVVDMNMHPFVSEDKSQKNKIKRNLFHCVNLSSGPGTLTGIMNDLGADYIYSEQLLYQARPNDVLVLFSGSGNSPNIVKASEVAKSLSLKIVVATRNLYAKCRTNADCFISVDGKNSVFPGQTGSNNNNFHFEDICIKLTHIAVGLLKHYVATN